MTATDVFADLADQLRTVTCLARAVSSMFKLPSSRPGRRQPRWATEMRQLPDGRSD
jgi:hypothetical protein